MKLMWQIQGFFHFGGWWNLSYKEGFRRLQQTDDLLPVFYANSVKATTTVFLKEIGSP
jgi:hypothetical protein